MKKSSLLAVLMAIGTAGPAWAGGGTILFGMVGIVAGQTARLNVVNTFGDPNELPCRMSLMFFDSEGRQVGNPNDKSLAPGKAAFTDFVGTPNGGRHELRAVVMKFDNPATRVNECGRVIATVEVFDTATGRTTLFYGDPER